MRGRSVEAFEELHIYQRARELTNCIYAATRDGAFSQDRALVFQIRRAAVSVLSNIAEGFERGSKTEFIQFLYIAKGSCGEVRAQLGIAHDQHYIRDKEHSEMRDSALRLSGMISNFIGHLKDSDYAGEKFSKPKGRAATANRTTAKPEIAARKGSSESTRDLRD